MVEFKGHVHNAHHFRHTESKFRVFFDVSIPPRVRSPIESPYVPTMCHDTTENRKQWEKKRKNKSLVSLKERMSERVGKRSKDREKKTKAREKESEREREKERGGGGISWRKSESVFFGFLAVSSRNEGE